MTPPILLSVITPTYNRLAVLQNLIDTSLGQIKRDDVEIIIVDDGSSDGTWEWLSNFCALNTRFRCYGTPSNSGPGPARNIAMDHALGRFFVMCDSDVLPMPGTIDRICSIVETHSDRNVLFVPCLEYPALKRMDTIAGDREISSEDLLYGRIQGEIIPIGRLAHFNERCLRFPAFRSGGESILWIQATAARPALFVDGPLFYYRTDVGGRICTAAHQLKHSADMAAIMDKLVELYPDSMETEGVTQRARRYAAAGMYHLLAGNMREARTRLRKGFQDGNMMAGGLLLASVCGTKACRAGFRFYREHR